MKGHRISTGIKVFALAAIEVIPKHKARTDS